MALIYKKTKNNKIFLTFIIILLNYKLYTGQINDNFVRGILEEGNSEFLDVTDNYNLKLIVTTKKNIYTGLPPTKKTSTNANLINATSIITINNNYLLAACLKDSLLTSISLNDGSFSPLIDYAEINIEPKLKIPETICSLSSLDNNIFIGYSRIEYNRSEVNKTNIVMKFRIENNNGNQFPTLVRNETKIFIFPFSTIKTNSARQISCLPLKILNDMNNYRLVCIHEDLHYDENYQKLRYYYLTNSINENFDNLDQKINYTKFIYRTNLSGGFRFFKLYDLSGRFIMRKLIFDITIKSEYGNITIEKNHLNTISFSADMDLFDYKSDFFISAEKNEFMNKKDVYFFRIDKLNFKTYFKLCDYKETSIKTLLCYYDESKYNIYILYQNQNNLKYFSFNYIEEIFSIGDFTKTFEIEKNERIEFDASTIKNDISRLGNINIHEIERNISGLISTDYFGINFYRLLMNNNILIQEKSDYNYYKYKISFIEHVKNDYTKIYYLNNINFIIRCRDCNDIYYYKCPDYENDASLIDNNTACYPKNELLKGYIYNENKNYFEKCFPSCDFCSSSSENKYSQNCLSCKDGYLFSYVYSGCFYNKNNLQINQEKIVNNNDFENFISSSCEKNRINSTGECIDNCPTTTDLYIFEYDSMKGIYNKSTQMLPPKYLFNRICYESCPLDLNTEQSCSNDKCECKCKYGFHTENNEKVCYSDYNCKLNYNYKNPDTNECYISLNDCLSKENNYFFNKYCYKNQCPENTVSLSSKNEAIQLYFRNNLLLDDEFKDKLCICNTNAVLLNNSCSNIEEFFQKCLNECPEGYIRESIIGQCIKINNNPTTQIMDEIQQTEFSIISTILDEQEIITTLLIEENIDSTEIKDEVKYTEEKIVSTETKEEIEYPEKNIDSTETKITEKKEEILDPDNSLKDINNCTVIYNNNCFSNCPENTCLSPDDPTLKSCIQKEENMKVYNNICFENLDDFTNNIKAISDNNTVITTESGITMRGYSTKSVEKESEENKATYTLVYLGECEDKLRSYYKIPDYIDIFIFGIDSPNKNESYATTVYNYEVYLENGTQLDYSTVCEGTKISISSAIVDSDLVKLDEAYYFADLGYDIYNENNRFYTDVCTPASVGGNDITLEDRKKYYSTSNISLCNESCSYSNINFETKRFTCECDPSYNFSEKYREEESNKKEEEISYIDYFLSFINYKIFVCSKLFLEFKSYFYNAGFYIAVGTLILCLFSMFIFLKWGISDLNKQIMKNIPNKSKLRQSIKVKIDKSKRKIKLSIRKSKKYKTKGDNPPKSSKTHFLDLNNTENVQISEFKKKSLFSIRTKRAYSQKAKKKKISSKKNINEMNQDETHSGVNINKKPTNYISINNKLNFSNINKGQFNNNNKIININKISIKKLHINNNNSTINKKRLKKNLIQNTNNNPKNIFNKKKREV